MTTTTIGIIIIVGLVLLAGAFLRWATVPVKAGYWVGRRAERIIAARRARATGQELDAAQP